MNKKLGFLLLSFLFLPALLLSENAVLMEKEGEVSVNSSGRTAEAYTGQELSSGDTIITGGDGSALILLSDGSTVELFSNSRLQLSHKDKPGEKKSSLLGELWQSIKGKFVDAEYSSAQAGGVGALRGIGDDEEILNDDLSQALQDELDGNLSTIDGESLPEFTSLMMKALLYEIYGQYSDAETLYLAMVELNPREPASYDMLIDLYMKIDCYGHVKEIISRKNEVFGE